MHGVTTIKLGGETRIINLNLHSTFFLMKELNCEIPELEGKLTKMCAETPLRALSYIIYTGILGHLETEAIFVHDITLKKVILWVGETTDDDLLPIWTLFKEVMNIPTASEKQIQEYTDFIKKKSVTSPKKPKK